MVRLAPLVLLCSFALRAQPDVSYPSFSSTAGLHLVGAARVAGSALRLTETSRHTAGAAWLDRKFVVSGGFDTTFQFQITQPGGSGPGADGFAFVLQDSGTNAIGGPGSAGGFALADPARYGKHAGIPQSIAIFFDTFRNPEAGDPSGNYIGIFTAGTPKTVRWPPARLAYTRKLHVHLKDGRVHTARIMFQPPVLAVYLDGAEALSSPVELATVADPRGAAFVGFTASTGNGYENHDILSWSFTRPNVESNMSEVSSDISFLRAACLPERRLCTPETPVVEPTGAGAYHIVLPANVEWGAAIPNPEGRPILIQNARGTVCWDWEALGSRGCNGPVGNAEGKGALISRNRDGRTWFSVDDPTGKFDDNEGYFEFDVTLR
jgi:hypothetical protein